MSGYPYPSSSPPPVAVADGLDLDRSEAELEALAEGAATTARDDAGHQLVFLTPQEESAYINATLAKLDHNHLTSHLRPVDNTPAQRAHPSITVHGVHGLDPQTSSRAEIEAKLEQMDRQRKEQKRQAAGSNEPQPDEQVLKVLAYKKLQLLQLHLKTDNVPILVLPATDTHGNLFLGSVGVSHHLPNLLAHGITHILSVGRNLSQPFPNHFQYLYIPMLDSSTTQITQDVYETSWKFIELGRKSKRSPQQQQAQQQLVQQLKSNNIAQSSNEQSTSTSNSSIPPSSSPSLPTESSSSSSSSSFSSIPKSPYGNVLVHCFAGKSRSTTILLSYLMFAQRWSLDQAYAHVKRCRPSINPNPGFLLQLRDLEKKLRAGTVGNSIDTK